MSVLYRLYDRPWEFSFGLDEATGSVIEVRDETGEATVLAPDVTHAVYGKYTTTHGLYTLLYTIDVALLADFLRAHADAFVDDDGDGIATMPDGRLLFPRQGFEDAEDDQGTGGDDFLVPSGLSPVYGHAGDGDDVIFHRLPPDTSSQFMPTTAYGEAGDDVLYVSRAYGGDGDDEIHANIGYGDAGNDRLFGGRLYGGEGDDELSGSVMYGGDGVDAYLLRLNMGEATAPGFEEGELFVFEEGVALSDLEVVNNRGDLEIRFGCEHPSAPDRLVIEDVFLDPVSTNRQVIEPIVGEIAFESDGREQRLSLMELAGAEVAEQQRIGEAGRVEVTQTHRGAVTWVPFEEKIRKPIVVLGMMTDNGPDPATVRVMDVTRKGFFLRVDEWRYLDGSHVTEEIGWMAVSKGRWALDADQQIEAGRARTRHDWTHVDTDLRSADVSIAATVQDENGRTPVTTRIRPESGGFGVRLLEEEAENQLHKREKVNWIGVTEGSGPGRESFGLNRSLGGDYYDESVASRLFRKGIYETDPAVFASMNRVMDPDTAVLRMADQDAERFRFFIQEEQSADDEVDHGLESLVYFAFDQGPIMGYALHDALL